MFDGLMLRLNDGRTAYLSVDDDGDLRLVVDHDVSGPVVNAKVTDDLALARLAVWARDKIRQGSV